MKGIILAGGQGTRLYPLTKCVCKQLLPVYDKPLIYYPLTTLMLAGIREILIITTTKDQERFIEVLSDGSQWGVQLSYAIQDEPKGIGDAFLIGEKFLQNSPCCLILGDNILYMGGMQKVLQSAISNNQGATLFGYNVSDPKNYGIVSFDTQGSPSKIEEKPHNPQSNCAIIGLYFYDNKVVDIAKKITPSPRGELEICDINQEYLEKNELTLERFGRGVAWFDAGTCNSLIEASQFVQIVEMRQGLKIACPEEIAFLMGYINKEALVEQAASLKKSGYGKYLLNIVKESLINEATTDFSHIFS